MKILRSVNRRSFNIAPAGFFNVLRPNTRFTALHPPRDFHYLGDQPNGTDRDHAEGQESAKPLQITIPSTQDRTLLRSALIVLAAVAITLIALMWIDGNLFARHFGW